MATLGEIQSKSNAKKAVCLQVATTGNVSAPSSDDAGIPVYPTNQVYADNGHCYTACPAVSSTLMVSGYLRAELDMDAAMTTNVDTVIRSTVPSATTVTIATVADGTGAGSFTRVGNALTFHYETLVTTILDFETAIAALEDDDALIEVKTAGTPTDVFTSPVDTAAATALALADAVLVGTLSLWGYLEASDTWHLIKVNAGSALAETASNVIGYQERYSDLGHYDRLALSVASSGGTGATFEAWLVTSRTVSY